MCGPNLPSPKALAPEAMQSSEEHPLLKELRERLEFLNCLKDSGNYSEKELAEHVISAQVSESHE